MTLKAILTKEAHASLSEGLRSEYKLDEKSGMYRLDVEPVDGWGLEDVKGLKAVLSDRTERHREASEKLKAFGDLTPESAREAIDKLKALGDMGDKAKFDAHVASMTKQIEDKYRGEITKRDEELAKLQRHVEKALIDGEVARLLSGSVDPSLKGSHKLLIGAIRSNVKVEKVQTADGEGFAVRVMDPKTGAPLLSQRQGNNGPMELQEYLLSLRNDPDFALAFVGSGSAGGGAPGSGNNGSRAAIDPNLPPVARLAKAFERGEKS